MNFIEKEEEKIIDQISNIFEEPMFLIKVSNRFKFAEVNMNSVIYVYMIA